MKLATQHYAAQFWKSYLMNTIDKIIVSSDSSPMFLNYWPVVAQSWKEIFNLVPILVLVAPSGFDTSVISRLRDFGEVEVLEVLTDIPEANQAKLARWFYACKQKSSVVSIEDIDTIQKFLTIWKTPIRLPSIFQMNH